MQVSATYSFKIKVGDREYTFNIMAESQEQAKSILLADIQQIVVQLNTMHFGT